MNCPIALCGHDLKTGYDMMDHLLIYHSKIIICRTFTKFLFADDKEKCNLWKQWIGHKEVITK